MSDRIYLDWNASAPLRPEAREAMEAAMDVVGNPSSVHGEGRAAKAIIESARVQVAEAFGALDADVIFTSGATESAALALKGQGLQSCSVEHDCVKAWTETSLSCDSNGLIKVASPERSTLHAANSETGVVQDLPKGLAAVDFVQGFGKIPLSFGWSEAKMGLISSHKIGGPKGVGALVVKRGTELEAQIRGGGHEMGRRAGTENTLGIAGFGAAAAAAVRDLNDGVWDQVEVLRNQLEERLLSEAPETIIFGKSVKRLPNTSYFAVPGWSGETQVMQMDLAGCAVSAGSACSSGKVKASQVLLAMGYGENTAASAIRVSIGPTTTEAELLKFADIWLAHYRRFASKAA